MNVLVTGANGFIGSHLVEELVNKNYKVHCLVRKSSDLRWIENLPVQFIFGDVADYSTLINAVKDKEKIFHLAGITKAYNQQDYYRINAEGTKNLLKACAENNKNIRKVVYLSTLAVNGPAKELNPLTEDAKCNPISDYGKSKYGGEKYAVEYMKHLPITVIRPPVVYGPRDKDVYFYFQLVNKRIKLRVGFDEKYLSIVFVKDLVKGIVIAAESNRSTGQIYFIAEDKTYSYKDISTAIATSFKKKGISLILPYTVIQGIALFSEFIANMRKKPALINRQKIFEMKQKYWICSPAKAIRELDYKTDYPLSKGIKITAVWYRKNHWV